MQICRRDTNAYVYSWRLDEQDYKCRVNNMFAAVPIDGVISMSYIAIGKSTPQRPVPLQ